MFSSRFGVVLRRARRAMLSGASAHRPAAACSAGTPCPPAPGGSGRRSAAVLTAAVAVAVSVLMPAAEAAFPRLSIILPRGVQRGGDREVVFRGERLGDAAEVLLHGEDGIVVKAIEPIDANSFKAIIHVPEACPAGEQLMQVRTRSGITEYRSLWIGSLPIVDEKEPNSAPGEPQMVSLGTTVHGIVESEDLDHFGVELTEGARLSVEVEGLRLGSHRFDPYLAIFDPAGKEIAAVDDSPTVMQDGLLSIVAAATGRYVVQVREASYGGDGNSRYRLHIGSFPRPTAVYPAGGKAGEKVPVTFLGDSAGPLQQEITVPNGAPGTDTLVFAADAHGASPTGLPFRISPLGNALEQEPNDEIGAATSADVALAFNGVIEKPGDVDHFRFGAKKGQVLQVECLARRLRSGLDPVVNILRVNGQNVAGNDDSRGPDSAFTFTAPEDGEYVVRVTDHLRRGRPDFIYRVELLPPAPSLRLSIPRIDRYSQTRQTVFVPRGNRYAVLVNASRQGFDGDLMLDAGALPPGITMTAPTIKAGKTQVPVVFEAAADAPLAGGLIAFEARQVTEADPEGKQGVRGRFTNDADLVLGEPNNAVHYSGHVEKLAAAVIEEVPFHVEIVQPKAPLVRRGTMDLKVIVKRGEGFAQPVTVEFPFRPAGVSANPSLTIPPDQSEGVYQLNANDKAETGQWPVYVLAAGDVGGTAWVASPMATLEISEPFTEAKLARSSCEQGAPAQIPCALTQVKPFEGEATARLLGLPPETSAPELKFTKETTELVFQVATNEKSPPGNHKSVFVEIVTPVNGEPVRMSGGGAELQIAKPAPAAAQAAAPAQPTNKPLSRLEKLRQQAAAAAATP